MNKTPIEDLKKSAIEHYNRISEAACEYNSFVKKAIENFNPKICQCGELIHPSDDVCGNCYSEFMTNNNQQNEN